MTRAQPLLHRPIRVQSNGQSATITTLHTRFRASSHPTICHKHRAAQNFFCCELLSMIEAYKKRGIFYNSLRRQMKTKQVFTSPAPSPLCLSFVKSTQGRKAAEAFRKCQLLPLGLHHMSCPSNKRVQASRYEKTS